MLNAISQGTQTFRSQPARGAAAQESNPGITDLALLGADNSLSSGDGVGTDMAWRTYSRGSNWSHSTEASIGWRSEVTTTSEHSSEQIVDDRGTLQYYDMFHKGSSTGSARNGIIWRDKNHWANEFERGSTYLPG